MADALLPHGLSDALHHMLLSAETAARAGLTRIALAVEADAKEHAGEGGAHQYGTPTPARRGAGPAVVSGDLRRAVTHTPIEGSGEVLSTRVGAADIPHRVGGNRSGRRTTRRRGRGRSATCGEVGLYVERMGYPWLTTAFDQAEAMAGELFGVALEAVDW